MSTVLDAKQIQTILPHRYPFLMVDRVLEMDDVGHVVAEKFVSANEPCFTGHFPGEPIFPGVLQLEALAQTAGILVNRVYGAPGEVAYYLGLDGVRFRRLVRPGDILRLEANLIKRRGSMVKMKGVATVDGAVCCEAEMLLGK